MIDRELSRVVRRSIRARPGHCWRNAFKALCAGIPELAGAVYCEGSILSTEGPVCIAIQHAWLELPDGRIVDPTLPENASGHTSAARYTPAQLVVATKGKSFPVTDDEVMDATHAKVSRELEAAKFGGVAGSSSDGRDGAE